MAACGGARGHAQARPLAAMRATVAAGRRRRRLPRATAVFSGGRAWSGWTAALVLISFASTSWRAEGAANGSTAWSDDGQRKLPVGWDKAQLDSGKEFYFRLDEPDTIFWEWPELDSTEGPPDRVQAVVPPRTGSSARPGAAVARAGHVIGIIELCDSGHLIGLEYDGLLSFMRRYGFHYINRHPQKDLQELEYRKNTCRRGELEPHILFVEKDNRSAVVEELSLRGLQASDILEELLARGIDASVRHAEGPPQRRKRSKWGPNGEKLQLSTVHDET